MFLLLTMITVGCGVHKCHGTQEHERITYTMGFRVQTRVIGFSQQALSPCKPWVKVLAPKPFSLSLIPEITRTELFPVSCPLVSNLCLLTDSRSLGMVLRNSTNLVGRGHCKLEAVTSRLRLCFIEGHQTFCTLAFRRNTKWPECFTD